MKHVGEDAGALMPVAPDHDVLERGHAKEDLQVLERPRQAPTRELLRRERAHILSSEPHASLLRKVEAGDDVEQRRLAGAVRTDDGEYEAGRDRQAHIIDRMHPAEGDRQVFGREDGHARLAASALVSVGTMPARRKIMTAMTMRPSTMCS